MGFRVGLSEVSCLECGAVGPRISSSQKRCAPCQKKHNGKTRDECRRRARGSTPLGTTSICLRCSGSYVRTGSKQKHCLKCKIIVDREHQARYGMAQRRRDGIAPIGSLVRCRGGCGTELKSTTTSHKWCPLCESKMRGAWRAAGVQRNLETNGTRTHKSTLDWKRRRYREDPAYRLNQLVRKSIKRRLANPASKEGRRIFDILGWEIQDLMPHLEARFTPGMSWANAGQWHLDHWIALSRFKFSTVDDPGFKAAWALKNLQPLWGAENIKKGARLPVGASPPS